ncbi:hypothetical protein CN917_12625 [Bacillus thuringiensis]|uniref:ATP-grasp domain-containing protein n=1 Tax=Bacillus cereus TaxID=1396 RepID=A0AAN6B9D1_BACCE|nr:MULTISPECIES: ATP-grasp domain-containing protein [Bacillus]AUB62920.1 hypothetical protein CSW12_07625 [Bacillus cereus]KAB2453714.1 ATP-grasp domain-containing protein [Bacillus cereus]KAB2488697.1 ATP-grasp domain-containing protein [Bacillus cereus]MBJ7935125.1 ATP-grasp domain-containing protein [Bacillus cereus]MCU4711611.1 ATP-grasp domain-containing protein [Bacillus cereus]
MTKKIAIIHEEIHPLLNKIYERLEDFGCEPHLVHWNTLGLEAGSLSYNLEKFDTVYLDRMGEIFPSYSTQLSLLQGIAEQLSNTRIVNNPKAYSIARNKALMAVKLATANLPIPLTKIAYTKNQIEDFCKQSGHEFYIAKSFLGACAEDIFPFPNGKIPNEVINLLDRDGMVIVQEFIYNPNRFIWRIDIVDSQVIQCNQRFAYNDDFETPLCNGTIGGDIIFWEPSNLPSDICNLAVKAVSELGLDIAGVDILVSDSGSLFIAEVNPEPDITLDRIGFPYAIADYLRNLTK